MMTVQEVLAQLGGMPMVRDYLRGLEDGSEAARDAQRAMYMAIEDLRAGGVHDTMATVSPYLYGQACLLLCRLATDAEDEAAQKIQYQIDAIVLKLRHDPLNRPDE